MSIKKIKEEDILALVKYIEAIPMPYKITSNEFGYINPVLICLDAVLSISRHYYAFVVPRIKNFEQNCKRIKTLEDLLNLINEKGYDGFSLLWNYRHVERIDLLIRLANKFIAYKNEIKTEDDLSAMKDWALNNKVQDFKSFKVKGIGLATYQYLRMMLGVSTVKPDTHIKKALRNALKRNVGDIESIYLIEETSKRLGLATTFVDHNLWRYFAVKEKSGDSRFETMENTQEK